MHASSMENMARCFRRYVGPKQLSQENSLKVLDIGGANVNGSYRDIIEGYNLSYLAADIADGEGVDVHMVDPYKIPLDDDSIDIVISGQAFEHVEFFWLLFEDIVRVVRDNGFIFLIAPSSGVIHRHPVDCYRFYPDSYYALAKYTNIHTLEVLHDERGPWCDLVGVFSKKEHRVLPIDERVFGNSNSQVGAGLVEVEYPTSGPDAEVSGTMPYLEFVAKVHELLEPDSYFEIGVREGHSAALANCKSIGVDPAPAITQDLSSTFRLFPLLSDEFFEELPEGFEPPDLAFIDGMHLFEYVLRDFINVEKNARHHSVIIIDDIFPCTEAQASRERITKAWMGDVWKIKECLSIYRPDLICIAVDTYPSGLLVVFGADSANTVLTDKYNEIVKRFARMAVPPFDILSRKGAFNPKDPFVHQSIQMAKVTRQQNKPVSYLTTKIKQAFLKYNALAKQLDGI
ncbi:methyltransferase domain-containing protein [Alteromonas sp. K632G]|uniref:class I SAM-dependent methyltransferase n=1 Tax=Alteromonas sp. K632G TaxID=2820757 RepID=UPI000C0EB7F4|nr:class I SAM-dependent methyltransferase [Alteromonas sp. K632G]MBO7924264.1 methyltransferase domain-containing protein [Alteromonas sp. K632G]PHS60108.1 MAG: methyltransferase type 11 [Alteromonas sp.]